MRLTAVWLRIAALVVARNRSFILWGKRKALTGQTHAVRLIAVWLRIAALVVAEKQKFYFVGLYGVSPDGANARGAFGAVWLK